MTQEQINDTCLKHAAFLNNEGGERADFRGADLSGKDLRGKDLAGIDFSGANFTQ